MPSTAPSDITHSQALRVSERRRLRNKSTKSAVKTYIRTAEESIADSELNSAEAVRKAISALDKAAEKDIIHKNNAARRKSRLMKRIAAATGGSKS